MAHDPLNNSFDTPRNTRTAAGFPDPAILDETLDRYRFLAEAMPLVVWTARADGVRDYYNPRWYEFTGQSHSESEGSGWHRAVHPDDLPSCVEQWSESVRTGRPYEIECRFRRASDGCYRWHLGRAFPRRDEQGAILQWVGTYTDIDDQKRSELESRQAAEFAHNALDGLLAHIAILDENGRILMVNRSWQSFADQNGPVGGAVSENANYLTLCGASAGEQSAEAPFIAQGIRSVLAGEQDMFQLEYPCHSAEEKRWFNLHITRFPEALPLRVIVAHEDITSRKLSEEALRRRAQELASATYGLERSNRELDQFAYVTSHDLKAPLRGIANLTSWIEEDLSKGLTQESRAHLELLRGRVNRMEAMIDGILQYSRIGRTKFKTESVDIHSLLTETIDLLAPPAEVQISIVPPMPTLVTDRLRVQQVFMNLIGNAIKHAGRPDVQIRIAAEDSDGFVEFTVSDNGPGIAPQYHEKIFELFQTLQARDRVEGAGIGLPLVKTIIEQQGGSLRVESREGAGSTFRFTLAKQLAEPEQNRERAGS